jgi:hypothetical protein
MNRPLAAVGAIAGAALVLSGLQVAGAGSASANPAETGLVISEVYFGSSGCGTPSPSAPYDADFVELYNPTSASIALTGTSLQLGRGVAPLATVPLSGTVPSGRHFLVQMDAASSPSTTRKDLPTPDQVADAPDICRAGWIVLGDATGSTSYGTGDLAGKDHVIDAVGFQSWSDLYETEPTTLPKGMQDSNDSLNRSDSGEDTDDNAVDFTWAGPTPENNTMSVTRVAPTLAAADVDFPAGGALGADGTTYTSGAAYRIPVTVSGGSGTPTGTVRLGGTLAYPPAETAIDPATGTATLSLIPVGLDPGPHTLTVLYNGDATNAPASTTFTLTITAGTAPVVVTAPDASLSGGGVFSEHITVAPSSAGGEVPRGFVSVWQGDSNLTGSGYPLGSSGSVTANVIGSFAPGVNTLTVTYSGDPDYAPSSTTFVVTVPSVDSTTTVTAPPTTYGTAGQVSVSVTAPGATVAGDVTLTGAGDAQTKAVDADGNVTFDLPATLAAGTYSLTASYAGTNGVNPSTGTATFTVAATSTGGATVQPPAGNVGTTPGLTPAQQKLKKDRAKLKTVKKKIKKAHGAKKTKLKKKMKKLKKKIKKDKKLIRQGK